jgi:hypothetical protein
MDPHVAQAVRSRAREACEYCLLPQSVRRLRFQVEHIIAKQHGGSDEIGNLALACGRCNRHKGANIAGIDPLTGSMTRLFNPRCDRWSEHFGWDGPRAMGLTPVGRTTVTVLAMNHPEELAIREEMIEAGLFPPIPVE